MRATVHRTCLAILALCSTGALAASAEAKSPLDELPTHIRRVTHFGQRADWSHDGKRILFLEKTYGDVFEIDLTTKIIRPITHHYYHSGYTRALYLSNGDIRSRIVSITPSCVSTTSAGASASRPAAVATVSQSDRHEAMASSAVKGSSWKRR